MSWASLGKLFSVRSYGTRSSARLRPQPAVASKKKANKKKERKIDGTRVQQLTLWKSTDETLFKAALLVSFYWILGGCYRHVEGFSFEWNTSKSELTGEGVAERPLLHDPVLDFVGRDLILPNTSRKKKQRRKRSSLGRVRWTYF